MDKLNSVISVVSDYFTKGSFDFKEFLTAILSLFGVSATDIDKMMPSVDSIIESIQKSIQMLRTLMIVAAILVVLYYIFNSLVWYKCAKKQGVKHAWLAWIPVVRVYTMGESATAFSSFKLFGKKTIDHVWIVILALPLCSEIVAMAFGYFEDVKVIGALFVAIGSLCALLLSLAVIVFNFCVLYKLYSMYVGDKTATIYSLFSLLGITVPFFVLSILKKERINDGLDFAFGEIGKKSISGTETKNTTKKNTTKKTATKSKTTKKTTTKSKAKTSK